MPDEKLNTEAFWSKISIRDCFQTVGNELVFCIDEFMRINNFPNEIREDVVETIREMMPEVGILGDH